MSLASSQLSLPRVAAIRSRKTTAPSLRDRDRPGRAATAARPLRAERFAAEQRTFGEVSRALQHSKTKARERTPRARGTQTHCTPVCVRWEEGAQVRGARVPCDTLLLSSNSSPSWWRFDGSPRRRRLPAARSSRLASTTRTASFSAFNDDVWPTDGVFSPCARPGARRFRPQFRVRASTDVAGNYTRNPWCRVVSIFPVAASCLGEIASGTTRKRRLRSIARSERQVWPGSLARERKWRYHDARRSFRTRRYDTTA